MALTRITAPSTNPVTLAEAKAHIRLDSSDADAEITAFIGSATEYAEQMTGRALMTQTWELSIDDFPDFFELTRTPVASITSIKYTSTAGVVTTFDASAYVLDASDDFGPAKVHPAYSTVWPTSRGDYGNVKVRYVAGYASASAVPEAIKAWIKLQVGAQDFNRGSEVLGSSGKVVFKFVDSLVDRFKVYL